MTAPLPENAVWLITGCSSGLGLHLSKIISQHPTYKLVATARKLSSLSYLSSSPNILKLALDVTSQASVDAAIQESVSHFGRIDVLINNAGYGLFGDIEGTSDAQARAQLETNFWGSVNMTKAILPIFREVNPAGVGGVVIQVSSLGGYIGFPGQSFYHASKFALEGFTEAVSKEMFPEWNIRFMIFEPGGMKTEYAGTSLQVLERHPAYVHPDGPTSQLMRYFEGPSVSSTWADPEVVSRVLIKVAASEDVPLRLPSGGDAWGMISMDVDATRKELDKWRVVSESTTSTEQFRSIDFLK